jgi:hypothetical protein
VIEQKAETSLVPLPMIKPSPDHKRTYRIRYRSEGTSKPIEFAGKPATKSVNYSYSFSGSLEETIVATYKEGQVLKLDLNLSESEGVHRSNLEYPLYVKRSHSGKFEALWFHKDQNTTSQGLLRDFLSLIQIDLKGPHSNWQSSETTPNGILATKYESSSNREPFTFKKTCMTFSQISSGAPDSSLHPVCKSHGTIALEQNSLLTHRGEFSATRKNGDKIVSRWSTHYSIELIDSSPVNEVEEMTTSPKKNPIPFKRERPETLDGLLSHQIGQQAQYRRTIGNQTKESFLRKIALLNGSRKNDSQLKKDMVLSLHAFLMVHPEDSLTFAKLAVDHSADSAEFSYLIGALEHSGHDQAQEALRWAADQTDGRKQVSILASMGLVERPTIESENYLRYSMDRGDVVGTVSTLSLGIMADRLGKYHSERHNDLITLFSNGVHSSQNNSRRAEYIAALGNSAAPKVPSIVKPFLQDSDSEIRTVALRSLRDVPTKEARALLLQALEKETLPRVRLHIVESLGRSHGTPHALEHQSQILKNEPNAMVRLGILKNLWRFQEKFPESTRLLHYHGENDPSPEVRRSLRKLLLVDAI